MISDEGRAEIKFCYYFDTYWIVHNVLDLLTYCPLQRNSKLQS